MKAKSIKLKVTVDYEAMQKSIEESVRFTLNGRERDLGMTSDQIISLHGRKCIILPIDNDVEMDKALSKSIKVE